MHQKLYTLMAVGAAFALAAPATAAANVTLGTTTQPPATSNLTCSGAADPFGVAFVEVGTDPSTTYTVPAPGGQITQWQTETSHDSPGQAVSLIVLRPSGGNYTVVGLDSETIPSGALATFPLSTPISVNAGDVIGLYLPSVTTGFTCGWDGVLVPKADVFGVFGLGAAPATGSPLNTLVTGTSSSTVADVAATLVPSAGEDIAVTSSGVSGISAAQSAVLHSTVTNNGPGAGGTITFTEIVPSGLHVEVAAATGSSCSVAGQTVACSINGLAVGQSAPVTVVVTPSSPGSYTNSVSVAAPSGVIDPHPANNTAQATLTVGLSLPAKCVVPSLRGLPSGTAKTVLRDLGCKVTSKPSHSKSVRKGMVIKTAPGRGTYGYQHKIILIISSGPTRKHHK